MTKMSQKQEIKMKEISQLQSSGADKQERLGLLRGKVIKQIQQNSNLSENFAHYKQFMGEIIRQNPDRLKNQINKFSQNLKINDKWNSTIKIEILKTNSESIAAQISLGYFHLKVTAIKIKLKYVEGGIILGRGTAGSVTGIQYENKQIAIKAIMLKKEDFEFQDIYRQFLFAKVAQSLKIGAPIISIFGYDIVIFSDCAIFCMQKCQTEHRTLAKNKNLKSHLKESLAKLHAFKICHCDIKTNNIGISTILGKPVFLDFGLTRILQEKLGEKSMSSFSGTYKYCSQEMKKLYFIKQKKVIDVYFNDVVCLKNTIQQLQTNRNQPAIQFQSSSSLHNNEVENQKSKDIQFVITQFINVARLKYFIFQNKYQEAVKLVVNQKNMVKSVAKIYHEQKLYTKFYPINKNIYKFISHRFHSLAKLFKIQYKTSLNIQQMIAQVLRIHIKSKKMFPCTDQIIYQYYNKFYEEDCAFNELSWQDVFSIKEFKTKGNYLQHFQKMWKNEVFMQKLFIYLVPCSDDIERLNIKQRTVWEQKIINNIHKCLCLIQNMDYIEEQLPSQIALNLKLRFIFSKFIQSLKRNYNSKFAHSLRLMLLKIEDIASLNKIQQLILYNLKIVTQDIGMWMVKKIQFYLSKVILLNNGVEEYMRQNYGDIRTTKLLFQGKQLHIDTSTLVSETQGTLNLNQQSNLYIFKEVALKIFDPAQLSEQGRLHEIRQILKGFIYSYPEGRLQKQLLENKIIQCQLFKGHWGNAQFEQKIQSNFYKPSKFNEFIGMCLKKQNHLTYGNICKIHSFSQHSFPSLPTQMGFNQYLLKALHQYQSNSQLLLKCCIRHLSLYQGNYESLNELMWISIIRSKGMAKFNVLPCLMKYYLQGIHRGEITTIYKIDRCLRNIREMTKYFIMCYSATINKVAGQPAILELLTSIKQTYNALLRQAALIDVGYQSRSYSVKLIDLNLLVIYGQYDRIIQKIEIALKEADFYMSIGQFYYWWIFTLMYILIDPKFPLPNYHGVQLQRQQTNETQIEVLQSILSSEQNYKYKCKMPMIDLVIKISETYSDKIVYYNEFMVVCVHAQLLTNKYYKCFQYLISYSVAFEKHHSHPIADQHSFMYLRQVSKFSICTPNQILIQICWDFAIHKNMRVFEQFQQLGTILCAILIKIHNQINSYRIKRRLLTLCVFGISKASIGGQLQFASSLYEIHKSIYPSPTARKQLCRAKREGLTNYYCDMKCWLALMHKAAAIIRKQAVKQNIQIRLKRIKYNHQKQQPAS